MAGRSMDGPRLPYVVRRLEGTVPTKTYSKEKDGPITEVETEEDAGYIAFFPQGHWLRIRNKEDLVRYGLNRKPRPIGEDGLAIDPRFSPQEAFENLEARVVRHVIQVCGQPQIPGFKGEMNLPTEVLEDSYAD